MLPNDYINTLEQTLFIAVPQITAFENANVGDFNDAVKYNILKSKIREHISNLNKDKIYQQSSYNSKIIEASVISQSPDIQKMIDETTKRSPSNLKTKEDYGKYYLTKFLNDLDINDLDSNYFEKPFQRSHLQKKKWILPVNKLSSEELNTQCLATSNQSKTYNELFSKLSPVMRKMYLRSEIGTLNK
ncbi:4941_t:CDS:2, partial [Diversispora eburnea]